MNILYVILLFMFSVAVIGCQATHILYSHETNLGVDFGISPDETSGELIIGYDRDTYALIPKKENNSSQEAMGLASVSCVDIEGLNKFHFNQFIATGKTANEISKHNTAMEQIQGAIYGGGSKQCTEH